MNAGERQLKRDDHQNGAGRLEKSMQRNAQRSLEEKQSNRDRDGDSDRRTDPNLHAGAG